jgi:O-antigen/teichoic acid export membrane protein
MQLSTSISELFKMHLPAGSLRARMARGAFWTFVGSVIAQGAGVLGSILSARILGKVGFGELGMIRSTVLMFGVLAGTGLGMAATKYVAEFRVKDPLKAGRMIGMFMNTAFILGGGVTLICLIIATPLAKWAMNAPHLSVDLQVGCLLLLLNTLNGVQLGAVCGFEAFRTQSQVIVLDGIFNLVLIPAGAFFYGVTGAVGGSVVAALLGLIVKQWAMQKECNRANIKVFHRNVSAEFPALWRFVLPAVLVGVSAQPFDWLARLIIVRGPDGYSELGLFAVALSLSQMILFLPSQLVGPTGPILSNLTGLSDVKNIQKILLQVNIAIIGITGAIGALFAVLSPVIMLAYGSEYSAAARTLVILAASSVFCTGSYILKNFLYAVNRVWIVVWAHVAMGIILCAVSFLMQNRGANGLAMAYVLGWLVLLVVEYSYALYLLTQMRQGNRMST